MSRTDFGVEPFNYLLKLINMKWFEADEGSTLI